MTLPMADFRASDPVQLHSQNSGKGILLGEFNKILATSTYSVRHKFHLLDTEAAIYDCAWLASSTDVQLENPGGYQCSGAGRYGGYHRGNVWTNWVGVPTDGKVRLRFGSDGSDYYADGYGGVVGREADYKYSGVVSEAWEYRQYEAGANVISTPLRYPGAVLGF